VRGRGSDHSGRCDTGWRVLRGDDVGVLLADHLMRRGCPRAYATTIVSSALTGASAGLGGCPTPRRLTGSIWIVRAGDGSAHSDTGTRRSWGTAWAALVRDKDGISAALLSGRDRAGLRS